MQDQNIPSAPKSITDEEFENELFRRDERNRFYIKLILFGISSGFVLGVILFILVMITST